MRAPLLPAGLLPTLILLAFIHPAPITSSFSYSQLSYFQLFLLPALLTFSFCNSSFPTSSLSYFKLSLLPAHPTSSFSHFQPKNIQLSLLLALHTSSSSYFEPVLFRTSKKMLITFGSARPCNTLQYHAVPCIIMHYHAIPCDTRQNQIICKVPCITMQYLEILSNSMQYHALWYKSMLINAILSSIPVQLFLLQLNCIQVFRLLAGCRIVGSQSAVGTMHDV